MPRFLLVLAIVAFIFIIITYVIGRASKNRYIKYIPSLVALIGSVYYFIKSKYFPYEGFEDLASILMSTMLFIGFIASGITARFINYRR